MDTLPTTPLSTTEEAGLCYQCHQPILPTYYFCPNCGANLHPKPLSKSIASQALLYFYSILLPFVIFIGINKWKGWAYLRSKDEDTKTIGIVALVLMIISTILIIWLSIIWTQQAIKTTVDGINADFNTL